MKKEEKNRLQEEEHFIFYPTGTPECNSSQQSDNAQLANEEQFFEYACVEIDSAVETDGLDSALGL